MSAAAGAPPDSEASAARQRSVTATTPARFRTTLGRVILVQLVTLVLLWMLQARYTP